MTDGPGSQEILFLDDFNHSNIDLQWDHIKFDHAILIDQIRILPDNCPIRLSNGSEHRGGTTPSKFHLDFFSNNLHKTEADSSCLDKLGSLNYEESNCDTFILKTPSLPTDWLVVAGSYKTLSIAVIGNKMQKSSPTLAQLNNIPIIRSGIPSTVNGKFPPLIRHHQRHHPYAKPNQPLIKMVKEESSEEFKIETSEIQDEMEDINESSIVKFYLNLDECKDEKEIVTHSKQTKVENLNSNFDPFQFRLETKLKKSQSKLDGLNFDLIFLIENLSQSMLDYLPGFKNQIHQMLKSKNIKDHNLIFKLCKNLHDKYPRFLIDQILDLSTLVIDLISFYMQQGFFYQIFKLVNWLNLTLNSAKSVENFVDSNYERLIKQFESIDNMSSRLTSAIGQLLLKIQFSQNLNKLSSMCSCLSLANLNSVKCVYESIVAYVKQNILTHNDSLLFPIEPIFSNKISLNKEIFNFFDEKNFFKNILSIWSVNDKMFNCLINNFMGDFFLPNAFNGHSFGPMEYLCNNAPLFNSIMDTCSHGTSLVPNLSYSAYLIDLFEQFIEQFNCLKKHRHGMEQFTTVNLVQEINFVLNEKVDFLTNLLSQPDGNFNNKYFRSLVEFFEYLIDDNLDNNLRCYAMNSITNILSLLCSNNLNWTVAAPKDYSLIKKLYKLSSHLFNNLIMTSLKPSGERNQSYFKLIDKLKLIISVLEPFYSYKDGDKNFLNYIIDSFREQIDKNLSQYLAKYVQNPGQALNYLNGNITQIVMLRNALKPCRQSDKLGKKIMLGNLINRNLAHLLANFLSRLNDYVTFYHAKCGLKKSDKLAPLIESCIWLIKMITLNLFQVQKTKFEDFYVAEILLDLMPNLNHVIEHIQSVKAELMEIFAVYYRFKAKKTLDLIGRFILKKPENHTCGLELLDKCLDMPISPIHVKLLFKENNHKYLIEENAPNGSACARMVKLICLSVELRPLFLRICKKLVSKDFLKIFIDYLIELIGEIKLNFNLNEVESFRKQEIVPKEDFLYEVEMPPFEETSHQFTQINLNEYKIFLVKKFVYVVKFVIHYANQIDRNLFLDLFQSEPVISTESLVNSSPNYSDFVPGLLHYFNQIDFNVKNSPAVHELCRIQEAILELCYLFIDTLDQPLVAKILVDHLGMSRLSHPQVDIKCLRCLIHLSNKQEIIKYHFFNLNYLINFINELAARVNDMCLNEAVDLMNSFYVYIKVLILAVMESGNNRYKLWTLFEWSEKNSNDSLIDSISMSSSSFNGSLLNCIINLDKSLELFYTKLKDDECKKKFKSIVNQSSSFIKYLNELDGKMLVFFGDTKLESECVDEREQIVDLELEMERSSEEILMQDNELYKKLRSNSEEMNFQCQPTEEFEDKMVKSKSPDMINTRTGIRYKAPMRGGHSNPSTRPMPSSASVPAISHLTSQNSNLIRTDSFRTRPQNTSRPPSLHVDDFYRIEQQQKQLNNSTDSLPNSSENQTSQNSSLIDVNNYQELTVKINENLESKNLSSISPQVKNLNSISVNMKPPSMPNSNQQISSQYINQSLVKITSVPNHYNMNQM